TTGYGSPERPHAAELGNATDFPDGTPVIDMNPAVDTDAGFTMAVQGPMVNVDLQPGETDACPNLETSIVANAMLADGNSLGGLVAMQTLSRRLKTKYGPLDHVDTLTYVGLWREAGARIGQYVKGQIVWE